MSHKHVLGGDGIVDVHALPLGLYVEFRRHSVQIGDAIPFDGSLETALAFPHFNDPNSNSNYRYYVAFFIDTNNNINNRSSFFFVANISVYYCYYRYYYCISLTTTIISDTARTKPVFQQTANSNNCNRQRAYYRYNWNHHVATTNNNNFNNNHNGHPFAAAIFVSNAFISANCSTRSLSYCCPNNVDACMCTDTTTTWHY